MSDLIRLNKFISDNISCTRRDADSYIEAGRVKVNGKKPTVGMKINLDSDKITFDGRPVENKEEKIFILFNKPEGISCSTELNVKDNISRYVKFSERVHNIFRLNKDYEGLLLLTNYGDVAHEITPYLNSIPKEYITTFNRPVTEEKLKSINSKMIKAGFPDDSFSVKKINEFTLVLSSSYELIDLFAKVCKDLDLIIVSCRRDSVLDLNIKSLSSGEWRFLTPSEVNALNRYIESASVVKEKYVATSSKGEEKITAWQSSLKRNKELKMAEASQNPKSKMLRSGRKKTEKKASVKTALTSSELKKQEAETLKRSRVAAKKAGMRLEDAINNKSIVESVRKMKKDTKGSKGKTGTSKKTTFSKARPKR